MLDTVVGQPNFYDNNNDNNERCSSDKQHEWAEHKNKETGRDAAASSKISLHKLPRNKI